MNIIKKIAAVMVAVMVLTMTACANKSEQDALNSLFNQSSGKPTSTSGAGIFGNPFGGEPAVPEPPKEVTIWDVLPEIPVTDASAFEYKYDNDLGGMVVTNYLRESPKVRIPDTIEGEPVVKVDFENMYDKDITELVMPDSVKEYWLSSHLAGTLQYINIPRSSEGLTLNGADELLGVYIPANIPLKIYIKGAKLSNIIIPEGVTDILLPDCTNLTSVNIPDSVTELASHNSSGAFQGCTSLTSVTIPDSVTKIGESAFSGCTNLTSVTIPDSVTEIWNSAFSGCTSLISIDVAEGNSNYYSVDGVLYSKETSRLEVYPEGRTETTFSIPDGVTEIIDYAFSGCTNLTSVTIPNSVTYISVSAFSGCTSLTSITIPNGVTFINEGTFSGCTSLTSVTIPNGVQNIGTIYDDGGVFENCTSLTSVTIPDSVTEISDDTFNGCENVVVKYKGLTYDYEHISSLYDAINCGESGMIIENGVLTNVADGLTKVVIPDSVTEIGDYAFKGCASLTSVTIPDSVTAIGYCAFQGCTSLTSITIPDSVTEIGQDAFNGCTSLTSVTIPDSVTEIGGEAFEDCESLTSVNIPNGVTYISGSAFEGCTSLTSVTIPDSVISIVDCAFRNCTSLTSVTIPDSVTEIGRDAFWRCESLTSATYKGKTYSYDNISELYSAIRIN